MFNFNNYYILLVFAAICRSSETLANCLTSFQELMDHGVVTWDFLTHGFIKNVLSLSSFSFSVTVTLSRSFSGFS